MITETTPRTDTDTIIIGTAVLDVLQGIYYGHKSERIGGKALTQAVALARLGGRVSIATALGDDIAANKIRAILVKEGIGTGKLRSGLGRQFMVNFEEFANGREIHSVTSDRSIREALSAAVRGTIQNIEDSPKILSTTFEMEDDQDLLQIWNYAKEVKKSGRKMTVIVNPAPMPPKRGIAVLNNMNGVVDILVPNRSEAATLVEREINDTDAEKAAQELRARFNISTVCITLGSGGCAFASEEGSGLLGAIPVNRVDKVGASDVFVAAFEMAITMNCKLMECVSFAGLCAGVSVSKQGGLESAPKVEDIQQYFDNTPCFPGRDQAMTAFESVRSAHNG